MNKTKKTIVFLIVILLIILVTLIMLLFYIKNNKINQEGSDENDTTIVDEYGKVEENGMNRNAYFDVNTCIAQYMNSLNIENGRYFGYNEDGSYGIVVEENDIKQNIYDLLSEKYINNNNITLDNLYEYVQVLKQPVLYVPLEISVIQDGDITSFIAHGLIENLEMEVIDEIFAVVNIDLVKNIFSIEPLSREYNSVDDISVERLEEKIANNGNNKFSASSPGYETIIKDYINIYKRLAIGSPERMYELLNKEYREKRFQNVDGFKEYVEENKQKIISINPEKYKKTEYDEYTEYICIDQNDNYYIFNERKVMDYDMILDTYTIDLPDFITKYDSQKDEQKAALNVNKIVSAINEKDYKYVYNKLNATYKNNYFSNYDTFVQIMKNNFYDSNELSVEKCESVGQNTYTATIKLTNSKDETQTKSMIITVKLLENRDFEMSFAIA